MYPDYPFASNFLQIDGHRLHYIDEGEGPVIVMVHGNPTWSYYYRRLISLFSASFRVVVLDHLGCGLSDKPQTYNYSLENHIDNLTTLLQALEIDRCSLIVHDWGGAIGMGYAGRNPDSVEKIVVLNTAAFRSTRIPLRIRICRWPLLGKILVCGFNGFAWPATFMAVTKPMEREVARAYVAPYDTWKNRVAIHAFVQDIPLDASHTSYKTLLEVEKGLNQLREKEIPMLILWGGKDFCFNRYFFDEWRERFPEAERHYFDDAGHYILEDAFVEIKPKLQTFFQI